MATEPRLYAPNAFTVNYDNLNDKFYVTGVFVKEFELDIFDRWGNLMFHSTDINQGWDGKFEVQDAKSDVYVFIAKAWGRKGKFASLKGNVTLLR
jgi:gliding motility-associated-like protein